MILVVEDHPDCRHYLLLLLRKRGYRVRGAEGGAQALELARAEVPRLFILDENMPGMTGMELLGHIKAEGALAASKVIFLSATHEQKVARLALDMGATEWLVKGVHGAGHILAAVERAVGHC